MKAIIKSRWVMLIVWLIAAVVLAVFTPNLETIINQRGGMSIPQSYPSQVAQKMIDEMSDTKGHMGIFVFYDKDTLSEQDQSGIKEALNRLKQKEDSLGITGIVDIFTYPDAKSQLVSEDNTTMIAQFTYEVNGRNTQDIVDQLNETLGDVGVSHYITGGDFIGSDYVKQTDEGVLRSAILTVAFILIVLIIMFRSLVAPLVSLLTVGVAYLTSMGIAGQLIDKANFPVTSLTQMFMILILFGIGTDYNILIFNRFKEELKTQGNVDDAIVATYRTAGKTILYCAITIFVAFAALYFAKFSVYQSGVAVAIGILVLILELLTLTPAVLRILGGRLFWPSKKVAGHSQSKIWEKASAFSVKRPAISLIVLAVLTLPVLFFGSYKLTFDNLKDMSSKYPSVVGFNTVAEHFSKGTSMPTTIVIKSDTAMDNSATLAAIDTITQKLKKLEGINSVMSATRPQGDKISDLYINNQTGQVASGLAQSSGGLSQIAGGLDTISSSLTTPDFSQVDQLVSGTSQLEGGMGQITSAINQLGAGINDSASGSTQLADSIAQTKAGLSFFQTNLNGMIGNYQGLSAGLKQFGDGYQTTQQSLSGLVEMTGGIYQIVNSDPVYYGAIKDSVNGLYQNLAALNAGFAYLNSNYNATLSSMDQLNAGLQQMSDGLNQMIDGLAQLEAGQRKLSAGLSQAGGGQAQIGANMKEMTDALAQISQGQKQLTGGLSGLGGSLTQLKDGISASSDGIKQIKDGLDQSDTFLKSLNTVDIYNLPAQALESADFQKALDAFMSKDRKITKIMVTLTSDPYSDNSIKTLQKINDLMPQALNGTELSDAKFAVGGETAVTNDLHDIAISDMRFTQIIVIAAIFILLVLIIKSFWIPVYIIGSLLLSYYSAISLTSWIAKSVLHTSELAWNVPFFGFLVIASLGVDYSIFLMTRYREYRHMTPHEAIIKASANVGGVVLSAAIILAGTFLTLLPSGLNTLAEIAICICIGIVFLSVLLLPVVIPSLISVQDYLTKKYSTME